MMIPAPPIDAATASAVDTPPLAAGRWKIALLAGAAIAISYLDRQTLPVAIKAIQRDIPISNEEFSLLNTAFLATYGIMYAGGGRLVDALGTPQAYNQYIFAKNFEPTDLRLIFAGPGTFWTDLKTFEQVGAAKIVEQKSDGAAAPQAVTP